MFSDLLIKIIVFLLPTQLGLHFWPSFSRVAGIKIDYLSPTLYLTDILLIILVFLNIKKIFYFLKTNLLPSTLLFTLIFINIFFSLVPLNSLFWWLRTLLYILTFITLRQRHLCWEEIRTPLLCSTIFVVSIELLQLYFQSSLGGLFYYFGERAYSSRTLGLGRFNLLGQEILRPISTFSHSNSLAGYLLIVFYLFSQKPTQSWHRLVPFLGILLTFSKTVILALGIVIFKINPTIVFPISIVFTLLQPLFQNYSSNWQTLSERLFYFSYLKKIALQHPISGVGLGNFIPSLGSLLPGSFLTPSKLQPIHNLPYLYISELGLLGSATITFALIQKKVIKIISQPAVLGLLALIIFTGTFDHYLWTLPQNKLIFLFALAIMF